MEIEIPNDHAIIDFIERNGSGLSLNYGKNCLPQWTLFTVVSQHVEAHTIAECFAKAMQIEKNGNKTSY